MGLLSFFSRKRKSKPAAYLAAEEILIPKSWRYSLTGLTIVTEPLGKTPGTVLEAHFIYSSLISFAQEIASMNQDHSDRFTMLAQSLEERAENDSMTLTHHEIIGIAYDVTLGYSARMSANGKKFTILLGEPAAVARASTPFHGDILSATLSAGDKPEGEERFVLAIDGIAYAALTLISIFK
jgi:hypothetical protein